MPHTGNPSPQGNSPDSGPPDRLSAAPEALFVYGSLLFPEVLQVLIGRVPESTPAAAQGWRAAALPGRPYPALVRAEAITRGQLISDLGGPEWQIIDAFEDPVYELRRLDLTDSRNGWAYVCTSEDDVLPQDWDVKVFEVRDLPAYIERCKTWRERYDGRSDR